jgi:NADH-quinone oxidoreductase subunit M
MVLSAVMVKMGLFGLIRWTLPVLPVASYAWGDVTTSLAVAGMIYASLLAIRQDDLKKLVAYSSIAHMGLMCAAVFAENKTGMQGVMVQMFSHGIAIIGLWVVADIIDRKTGTRKISELGGLAWKAPAMAIFVVVIALANIGLPLTAGFVGEFLMFTGLMSSTVTHYYFIFTILAGISIILAAVYMLNMIRNVFYGSVSPLAEKVYDIRLNEKLALAVIVLIVIGLGVYPGPVMQLTHEITDMILVKSDITPYLQK